MAAAIRIDAAARRARLAVRHHLAAPAHATDPTPIGRDLVALHATDPATVHLAVAARLTAPRVDAVEEALYERRSLVRMLGMRRTMFVVPVESVPVVQRSSTDPVARMLRRQLLDDLRKAGIGDTDWLSTVEEATLAALEARGSATANELAEAVPLLRTQLNRAPDKSYGRPQNITSRVLNGLGAQGRIVRGRPRGSWISGQYHWAPVDRWLPTDLPTLSEAAARTALVRQWLSRYGPGTMNDLKWWTGWSVTQVRAALSNLDTAPVDLDGEPGVLLADDTEPVPDPGPWVALLPALDPTVMGWARRDWYLGGHGPALFDRSGNPGPTVWCDGRIVGGWAQRADGSVAVRLLESVPRAAAKAIDNAAGELAGWLGDARVTPRFRTPLERELAG